MRKFLLAGAALGLLGLVAARLGGGTDSSGAAPAEAASLRGPALAAQTASPDTTAEALWRHLQAAKYRESWKLWPGKSRLYKGTEPHGMLLTTYTNDIAHRALQGVLRGQVVSLPEGSIIVKENYMPDSTFAAATVMYKVRGYNPEHQDWLFAKYDPKGKVDAFGRAPMCEACHRAAKGGAYLYTPVAR